MGAQVKFRQIVAEGKALKWILAFVLDLAVLLLVVLGVYEGTSVIGPAAEQSVTINAALLAEDLESMFGRSYVAVPANKAKSGSPAADPEVIRYRRYRPDRLMFGRSYVAVPADQAESGSPAANPETTVYRRSGPDRRR